MLSPRQSFFFFTSWFTFELCSLVASSPPKTFEQLHMKCEMCVVAHVVVFWFFFIWYHRLRADIMCFTVVFKSPFQGSFLRLPLEKDSSEPLCFFLSHQSFKCVTIRFRKQLIVHIQTMVRGACELYIPYSPFTCAQKEGDCIKVVRDKDLNVADCENVHLYFSALSSAQWTLQKGEICRQ